MFNNYLLSQILKIVRLRTQLRIYGHIIKINNLYTEYFILIYYFTKIK